MTRNVPISPHKLRHATLSLAAGANLKAVSERLGHATIVQTADTYAHVTETMQRDLIERVADLLAADG